MHGTNDGHQTDQRGQVRRTVSVSLKRLQVTRRAAPQHMRYHPPLVGNTAEGYQQMTTHPQRETTSPEAVKGIGCSFTELSHCRLPSGHNRNIYVAACTGKPSQKPQGNKTTIQARWTWSMLGVADLLAAQTPKDYPLQAGENDHVHRSQCSNSA